MNFAYLEEIHRLWKDILVIDKTIEHNGKKYYILGMTLADKAQLYIIEPYDDSENIICKRKGVYNQRRIIKEHRKPKFSYLHCSEFSFGSKVLQISGGSGLPLKYSGENSGEIQLFFDMMSAGWKVPHWLKDMDFDKLMLISLDVEQIKKLPKYSPEIPFKIKHRPDFTEHLLEKTVTLNVGKARSFSFIDHYGDKVDCYINNIILIDMWVEAEERFSDPRYTRNFSAEELQEAKNNFYKALEQSCPKDMRYVGIEYECTKDFSLQFYSKEYLKSRPRDNGGSFSAVMVSLKPDKKTGTHNLPLKGCVMPMAVSRDVSKIPAELFSYAEKISEWEESI